MGASCSREEEEVKVILVPVGNDSSSSSSSSSSSAAGSSNSAAKSSNNSRSSALFSSVDGGGGTSVNPDSTNIGQGDKGPRSETSIIADQIVDEIWDKMKKQQPVKQQQQPAQGPQQFQEQFQVQQQQQPQGFQQQSQWPQQFQEQQLQFQMQPQQLQEFQQQPPPQQFQEQPRQFQQQQIHPQQIQQQQPQQFQQQPPPSYTQPTPGSWSQQPGYPGANSAAYPPPPTPPPTYQQSNSYQQRPPPPQSLSHQHPTSPGVPIIYSYIPPSQKSTKTPPFTPISWRSIKTPGVSSRRRSPYRVKSAGLQSNPSYSMLVNNAAMRSGNPGDGLPSFPAYPSIKSGGGGQPKIESCQSSTGSEIDPGPKNAPESSSSAKSSQGFVPSNYANGKVHSKSNKVASTTSSQSSKSNNGGGSKTNKGRVLYKETSAFFATPYRFPSVPKTNRKYTPGGSLTSISNDEEFLVNSSSGSQVAVKSARGKPKSAKANQNSDTEDDDDDGGTRIGPQSSDAPSPMPKMPVNKRRPRTTDSTASSKSTASRRSVVRRWSSISSVDSQKQQSRIQEPANSREAREGSEDLSSAFVEERKAAAIKRDHTKSDPDNY